MLNKKIVIFNGPPGRGKDLAVKFLASLYTEYAVLVTHNKMADSLKMGVHKLFNLNYDPVYYDNPNHAHEKELPLAKLFGLTPRKMYIKVSEEFMKPNFGEDVFGQIMALVIAQQKADVHAFSDGGFVAEWLPIVDLVGPDNVCCIEIHATKDGKELTFDGDSRSYIGDSLVAVRPGVTVRRIFNEHGGYEEREFYKACVLSVVKKFLGIDDGC